MNEPTNIVRSKKHSSGTVTVLIVDDNEEFRANLKQLLGLQENIVIVGEAGSGMRAIHEALHLKPDLILMDIAMPGVNGPEAARIIKSLSPETKIAFLTIHDEETYRSLAATMHIEGLIPKQSLNRELPKFLRTFKRLGRP